MPPKDSPYGSDQLIIPCCFAKGYDDPVFLKWRQDHPDWFVAGTWTSPARSAASERRERQREATRATVATGTPFAPLDPSTMSVADFTSVSAQAKAADPAISGGNTTKPKRPPPRSGTEASVNLAKSASVLSDETYSGHLPERTPEKIRPIARTDPTGGVPLVLNDGTPVLDRSGQPMLVPPTVDVNRNIEEGRIMSQWSIDERLLAMGSLFGPGQPSDQSDDATLYHPRV